MKTAQLIPVVAGQHALGVIDVIEERHPDRARLAPAHKLLLATLAGIFAARWTTQKAAGALGDDATPITSQFKMWSRNVVNPLTTIIGSVELIRYKQNGLGADAKKYLATIERSAARIHETLFSMIETLEAGGQQPEPVSSPRRWTWTRPGGEINSSADFARPMSVTQETMSRLAPAGPAEEAKLG
jgi:hypothetical protein